MRIHRLRKYIAILAFLALTACGDAKEGTLSPEPDPSSATSTEQSASKLRNSSSALPVQELPVPEDDSPEGSVSSSGLPLRE